MRAGVRPAERGVPARSPRRAAVRRPPSGRAARVASRSFSSTARASSNRSIDRVAVGAEAERRPGVDQRPGRPDAVGEVAFGRGARSTRACRRRRAARVRLGQVGGVHGGRCGDRARRASSSSWVGVAAVRLQAGLVLGPLLGEVDVQRDGVLAAPTRRPPGAARRRTARTEWTAAPTPRRRPGRGRSASTRPAHAVGVAVAEPQLRPAQRRADHRGQVAGVQQRDPQAGLARRLRRARAPIAFGSSYGLPPGAWCR